MQGEIHRDGQRFTLEFQKGENVGDSRASRRKENRRNAIRWRPDPEVFTDIDIPLEYLPRDDAPSGVVIPNILFVLKNQTENGFFEEEEFLFKNGIVDYLDELVGPDKLTPICLWGGRARGARQPGQARVPREAFCGRVLFKRARAFAVLPQLELSRIRRQPRKGRARRVRGAD
jgi:hypothetical protein